VLRFSCLPNKAFFVSWLHYRSCRLPNKGNVPRKGFFPHRGRKLSGVSLTDGRGICRAYGHGSQPALPSPSRRSLFNLPRSHPRPAGPATQPRRGEDGPKRAACGREGTLPRKPRQLLSCSGANSPPVRQEGGLDVRPPSGEEAVRRSLTDGRGICRAFGAAANLRYPH